MPIHSVDVILADVAARQEALWSGSQASTAGASGSLIHRRLRSGRWLAHGHRVFGPPGVPWTHRRRLWEAHLAAGPSSVVSHEAAAVLHHLSGFAGAPVVVTRPHSGNTRFEKMDVHQISDCAPDHQMKMAGLPVTTPARTFVDLAAVASRARLRHALEDAVSARILTLDQVDSVLRAVTRRGKPGIHLLTGVLDDQVGTPPMAGELERRVHAALVGAGLPAPRTQASLPGRGAVPGIVDFLYDEARLIIEADGRRWHDRRRNMLHDRDRDNEAAAAGYLTMRVMWERIVEAAAETAALVAATYANRRRLLAAA